MQAGEGEKIPPRVLGVGLTYLTALKSRPSGRRSRPADPRSKGVTHLEEAVGSGGAKLPQYRKKGAGMQGLHPAPNLGDEGPLLKRPHCHQVNRQKKREQGSEEISAGRLTRQSRSSMFRRRFP